jgi:hypothetical protein
LDHKGKGEAREMKNLDGLIFNSPYPPNKEEDDPKEM